MAGELPQWVAECPVRADDGAPPTTEGQLADWEVSEDDNWEIGSIITCFEFQVPVAEPGTAWVPFGRQGSYKLVAITGGSFKEALIQPLAGSGSSLWRVAEKATASLVDRWWQPTRKCAALMLFG